MSTSNLYRTTFTHKLDKFTIYVLVVQTAINQFVNVAPADASPTTIAQQSAD